MAGIGTSIQVTDRLSPAFGVMTQSINMCLGAFADMQTATGQAVDTTAIRNAQVALYELNQAAAGIDDVMNQAAAGQENYNNSVRSGQSQVDSLLHKVTALVGAYASINAVKGIVGLSDQVSQTTARLNLMNDGMQTTEELQQKIMQSAMNSRAAYLDTANAIAKMGNNAGAAFSSNDELIAFMEQINKQFAIGGASAQEQSNAMLQLSQAMAAGALRGEELNSILEAAPEIARSIEQNMGWASGSTVAPAGCW